jgi:hypothetical protein
VRACARHREQTAGLALLRMALPQDAVALEAGVQLRGTDSAVGLVPLCRLRSRRVVRGGMPLHVPVVHLNDAGKENREECNEEYDKGQKVFAGEVAHNWQPCSTSDDTIVK